MAIVVMLGAGMMGSALTLPLSDNGHEIRVVGTHLDRAIIDALRAGGVHPKLGVELPRGQRYFQLEELERALSGADAVALGVNSTGVPWAARTLGPFLEERGGVPIVMIAKGLEFDGRELVVLPDAFVRSAPAAVRERLSPVAVAGPCIAGELARRVETAVVLTGRDPSAVTYFGRLLECGYYRVFSSPDVTGVEVCAALKNAYAMGIALPAGMHEARGGSAGSVAMHNLESAVFAEAVFEMARIVDLCGGARESVFWLPGVGDLDVTCNGGRTGRFGRLLGLGIGRDEAVARMQGATLECLEILRVMRQARGELERRGTLARDELPLLDALCRVALDGAPVELPLERFFSPRPR